MREQRRMNPDEKIKYRRLYDGGLRWQQLADRINGDITTSYTKSQVRDMLKRVTVTQDAGNVGNGQEKRPTLVFGDVHLPFEHKHYLQFLKDTDRKYNCRELKVCTGDIADNHSISRHLSAHDNMGAKAEYDLTREKIKDYIEAFPCVKICKSNHDDIPYRQAQTIGLYQGFIKTLNEAWGLPDTWKLSTEHIVDGVLYKHGVNCGGINGARATAIKEGTSTVIGHIHSHGGVHYAANTHSMLFGANAGCGIDVDAYAFEYGKGFKDKPTLGCVVVFNSHNAIFVPMDIDFYNNTY